MTQFVVSQFTLMGNQMALKALLDNLDGVDESIASLYTEQNGRYVLGVEAVDGYALEDIGGLKSSLAKERKNARDANTQLLKFGDIDPDTAIDAIGKLGDIDNWSPDDKVKEQIANREKVLTAKFTKDMEAANGELATVRGQLENQLIHNTAMEALTELGGNAQLLMPHITSQTKLELIDGKYVAQVIDENGVPRVSMKTGSMDSMSVGELVSSMRDSETFAPAFAGSGATGSGTSGSSVGSNASGKNLNMTWEQAHDVDSYRAMRQQAESAGSQLNIQSFDDQ